MFPMEFDYRILNTLPLTSEERVKSIQGILKAVVTRRVLPYFRNQRGTDALKIAQTADLITIVRLEDEANRIRFVSALTRGENGKWHIQVHERIFDYLAFVIPSGPGVLSTEEAGMEENKMLAFAELFLRHDMEHILYPGRKEREVIVSDVDFALSRRQADPTFHQMLRSALSDQMNGIKGEPYMALFDAAEHGLPFDSIIDSILNAEVTAAADLPGGFLQEVFAVMDTDLRAAVLGEYCRRSRGGADSLLERAMSLQRLLRLFNSLIRKNEKEALDVFNAFKDRWGLAALFQELSLSERSLDGKSPEDLFRVFQSALKAYSEEDRAFVPPVGPSAAMAKQPVLAPAERPERSLKDRIEDARNDPAVPRRVIAVIDKNLANAVGHSGSKYSELIETLLAIPWGKIHKITVSTEGFEAGLNRSHYGLQRPKDLVCDFYTNLIWRYQLFTEEQAASWRQTGSAFLFVGPPGVGKTSLAISIAQNLGIPYHKVSLAGMRDEADIRGHGFTYEGSKPGAILQGLIKMEAMNGMFILDEADKMEKFAIATLLEILDPEQNHLFHDKYTETTVDIDLSNCHFFLTANNLDAVPPVVVNRCEVVVLDRYSVEEKIAIAQQYLIRRIRGKYRIDEQLIYFDREREADLLRYLVRNYTYEAGVRELERIIRTLFLRVQRKEILGNGRRSIRITREKIKEYLKEPARPRQVGEEDGVGEMLGLGVDVDHGVGSIIPIQATRIHAHPTGGGSRHGSLSIIHATGNIEKVMDESRKVATTGIFQCARDLGIDPDNVGEPIHLHFMGGSTKKDGPSAGGAISLALASLLSGKKVRRDVAMTGEIDTRGRITGVGGLAIKIESAYGAGCRTVIIPRENLVGEDGIERFPDALKRELQILTVEEWEDPGHQPFDYSHHTLQVVAVDNVCQAAQIAFIDEGELDRIEARFEPHGRQTAPILQAARAVEGSCVVIALVKSLDEVDVELLRSMALHSGLREMVLLAPSEIADTLMNGLGDRHPRLRVRAFDMQRDNLSLILRDRLAEHCASPAVLPLPDSPSDQPVRFSIIAPYYFLKRDGVCGIDRSDDDALCRSVTLFSNNYTYQEVKFKGCKNVFLQVYCLLSLLKPSDLEACPFVRKRAGVYTIDMSFIPEQYRLDVRRAEAIVKRSMLRWLSQVGGAGNVIEASGLPRPMSG